MKYKRVELYYANWCPACQVFKPTWKKLKPILEKEGIECKEFEDSSFKQLIEQKKIKSYPTIRIVDMDEKESDYKKERTADSLFETLTGKKMSEEQKNLFEAVADEPAHFFTGEALNRAQSGGGKRKKKKEVPEFDPEYDETYYKKKYLKYKAKYMKLMSGG